MQYQQEIATISRVAPPTYAEAMAQAAAMKDNVPNASRPDPFDPHPQVPPYPASIVGGPSQSGSAYPSTLGQHPHCDPSYIGSAPIQQNQVPARCVVRVDRVVYKTRWKDRCCTPKVSAAIFIFFLVILMIKLVVAHSV